MRTVAILVLLTLATLTLAQSAHKFPAKKELSPAQQLWCPVLDYAEAGAKASEPAMRAYLLYVASGGLGKCDQPESPALLDSFNATLVIPEKEENVHHSASHDEAWFESASRLETKRQLQEAALRRLAIIDESGAESLLDKAEPSVRGPVLSTMIYQATSTKNYEHALELLSRTPPEAFPYTLATDLMLRLPTSRDSDRQEIFRLAMAADSVGHSFVIGGDDFGSMIVRFWQHIPPAVALGAIHQVLDAAQSRGKSGITLNSAAGNVAFTGEYDYRVFELMPLLRQLDDSEAEKLLNASQQAQAELKQFPHGIQSLNSAIGDTLPKDPVQAHINGSAGPASALSRDLQETVAENAFESRVNQIRRTAEDNPKQAIAAAATLPNADPTIQFGSQNPRADALLAVAKALMKKNPSAAKAALEEMALALKSGAHPYGAIEDWTEGMKVARQIEDADLALSLFRSGMDQADQLAKEDTDSDDPNIALKAWWPSVSAAWQLVRAASEISPTVVLERVRETKDPEILFLLEVGLANKGLGVHVDQTVIVSVRKKDRNKAWSQYGQERDDN